MGKTAVSTHPFRAPGSFCVRHCISGHQRPLFRPQVERPQIVPHFRRRHVPILAPKVEDLSVDWEGPGIPRMLTARKQPLQPQSISTCLGVISNDRLLDQSSAGLIIGLRAYAVVGARTAPIQRNVARTRWPSQPGPAYITSILLESPSLEKNHGQSACELTLRRGVKLPRVLHVRHVLPIVPMPAACTDRRVRTDPKPTAQQLQPQASSQNRPRYMTAVSRGMNVKKRTRRLTSIRFAYRIA